MLQPGQVVELEIESGAYEGYTVARHAGLVIFVDYGVPGDRVKARVTRARRQHAEAVIEEILRPSPARIQPRCQYFGLCGGCRLQHVEMAEQLRLKRTQVQELLERIGGLANPPVEPTLPSPEVYYYRNKMEFSCGRRWLSRQEIESRRPLNHRFALGLHIPRRFDRVLDLHECHLQSLRSVRIVNRVRELALQEAWEPYDSHLHQGFLRNLTIREARATSQLLVALVTTRYEPAANERLKQALLELEPGLTTLVNLVNPTRSPSAAGVQEIVLHGPGYLMEKVGDLSFKLDARSFFQPNPQQAAQLFQVIRRLAELRPGALVYDLYCGMGCIALTVAADAGRVVGVESFPDAVRLARENAQLNGIANCLFLESDAADALKPPFVAQFGEPDVVILDPPRAGLHPDVVKRLLKLRPPVVVYSSCNPATQARDLKLLSSGYTVDWVQPVDMFPQTYHIEAVARLTARPGGRDSPP